MVILISLLQSTQDGYGTELIRFVNHHCLESTLQGLVLLEVFLILIKRCGTDTAQFASRQSRFEDIGGIHGSLAASCSHKCVDLVDEEDDATFTLCHFVDHRFQSFLKLALILGSSHQCSHIEREELLVLKVLWHIASHYSLCKSLYDSCLTRTRFTY